jgi:hypothetical protein
MPALGEVLSPSGRGVLGQIRVSDTERIAAPRDNSMWTGVWCEPPRSWLSRCC